MSINKHIAEFAKHHSSLVQNFSYITALQLFTLVAPLITYPYLTKVLGIELYGVILTAQMLVSYVTLIVDFGSTFVCAKHVSVNRENINKLSEIVNSVLCVRCFLFLILFFVYAAIVYLIPEYRQYFGLFILSYGLVIVDVLYPQYFFQGIEKMKTITYISIFSKLFFIIIVFVVVRSEGDYLWVPVLYTLGYTLSGVISLYIIYRKIGLWFFIPKLSTMLIYVKDSSAIFATDLISTIKDKLNYLLVGHFVGMESVVVYDLALKLNGLITKPQSIINTVMFPRIAKDKSKRKVKYVILLTFVLMCLLVLLVNIFLPYIVDFFIHRVVDYTPIRLFLLAPIFLSISVGLAQNFFIAFGYNKYLLVSIIITTIVYILALGYFFFTQNLSSIYSFVTISLISYFAELLYRTIMCLKLSISIS